MLRRSANFFNGRTVVIVAHRLSTVKNVDQIVVLNQGKITEIGTHKELAAKTWRTYFAWTPYRILM